MREESSGSHDNSLMGEECLRLSSGSSVGGLDPRPPDRCSRSSTEPSEDGRPVSAVSSGSSVEGSAGPPSGIDLELSPPAGPAAPGFEWSCSDPPSPFATVSMAPNPQLSYVDRVVMEIIETERMYVRDLRSIVEDYLVHIIDTRNLPIKPEQVCSLFGNIEHIYEFNSELLQSLDMCANDPVAIARCFVDKSNYFQIYTQYCTNYPNSVAVLTDCLRNKTLAKFFRDRQASLKRSLPLGSYLLKPVQRILKYHLLLQEIAKHFEREEDGYDVVIEAIDSMTGVAWYINDMKRKHEHAVRLQEVQSLLLNWKGPDLTTYGELVLEGTFPVHRAKNERTLFLFDKMLLITRKRGEHYVFKTHISCSTLMLIESAKDSLRFSVMHYKHPKQPHTVQARTVEEKKLWAHHIKRLILENHHAVIPQKAKDAILDMDSTCPVKYRYSPDRLKKATSFQADDLSGVSLKERRRSEPGKRTVRSTKGRLKHADSEGTLLVDKDRLSILPTTNVTARSNPDLKTAVPGMVQSGQDLESSTSSLHDVKERRFRLEEEEEKAKTPAEDRIGGDNGEEEDLMGVEQVADFASSVLAAISCWRYRAKALLFDQITTDREGCWENWPMNKSSQTPCEEKPDDMNETLTLFGPGTTGEHSSPNTESEEMRMDQSDNYPEMCGTLMARCHTDPEIVDFNNGGREIGEDIKKDSVDFSSTEEGTTPCRSNLSEDVQNMEVDVDVEVPGGLLSSSMLDKASDIPERCTSSLSQSSLGVEGSFDLDSLEDRRSSLLSGGADPHEKDKSQEFRRSTPEHKTETVPDSPFVPDQRPQMKQDTLSKKDRLLIHKIRHYYEHAENQDSSFGVKRRESLSYIPAGLVRNLSQQLNDLADEDVALHRRGSSVTRPTLWSVFNLPGLDDEKKAKDSSDFVVSANGKESVLGPHIGNEQFQPASDMVKVWQDMEVEITGSSEEHQDLENSQTTTPVQETKAETSKVSSDSGLGEPLLILEESDESSTSSPINNILEKDKMQEFRSHPNEDRTFHKVNHPPLPRIISLRSANEDDLVLQDMEKMKNKVFQLARQYSQRIKNSRPVVRQRPKISEINFIPKNLSSVMEERPPGKEKGMPDRTLLLTLNEQDIIPDSKTTSPPSSLCSPGSPQLPYFCRLNAQRPQSPVQTESFHWPDVKELRSKYNSREDVSAFSRPVPVGRSNSFPERILDDRETSEKSGASRSLSCSSPSYSVTVQRSTSTDSACSSKTLEAEGLPSLCRVKTLDFDVGTSHALEQPDDFFDPGLDTLSNLIVVERAARGEDSNENQLKWDAVSQSELAMSNSKEQNFSAWMDGGHPPCSFEKAENSQDSLVKNLREKFQNLNSYT
ncbi:pleckstrin homology domain-containing family G member 3 isoform X2 [Rhinichthys klamathensis goyatoka]|uniref:pleckstrin homology domain-containing family G member 3 isoform X2 n=1 Tax=Rhinichthys klamathensis goyatoka TaxID=3034132 RepID=UPI0024B55893|nr:pleckstrin homology domain-containing family G member 3 isoform X2 [Rhinichthys klamathensis goyatoka]